jgi:SWI/SNF-related matrix-associated actin-dependent regulator 1 of chromatin subfamily A
MDSIGSRMRKALKTTPMRFQIQGVRFIEEYGGRVLLGHDMGLGKTMQAISWALLHPEIRPIIVVCPTSVKYVWQREFIKHAGMKSEVINGRKSYPLTEEIIILNYEILSHWIDPLKKMKPQLLIVDECHFIKSKGAQRTKACKKLSKTPYMLALSGTPMINRPVELFPVLQMLRPYEYKSFWKFTFRYCDPKPGFRGRGWDFKGASNMEELHDRLSIVMIRCMKSEVLKELPQKQRTIIPVEIDNRQEYKQAQDDFLSWLRKTKSTEKANQAMGALALVQLGALKRLAAKGKLKVINQWISDWFDATNQKLVVFAVHRAIIQSLKESNPRAVVIDGSTKPKQRQEIVDRFQSNPACNLLLGNIRAAGIGITLTAASTVLFAEIGWTPGEHDQAEDRVLRIGQEADSVNIYYIIGRNTIEEDIIDLIDKKRDICSRVLDGKEVDSESIMATLLHSYRKEKK